jgi:hypothetical protein
MIITMLNRKKHSLSLDVRGIQGIMWSKLKNISYNVNFLYL